MARALSWAQVWRRRLAAHCLLEPAPREQLAAVVGRVCGIHAQVAASAELSLGLRVRGLLEADVRQALWSDRTLVKTYGLRGTLHLFPTHELGLWLAALASVPSGRPATAPERQLLPTDRLQEVLAAMREALDGRGLTRDELGQALVARLGAWVAEPVLPAFGGRLPRWQLALGPASQAGLLAFGPNRGNRVCYVRLDQWLGRPPTPVDGPSALREVCRRYLAAYGPITHVELARWLATTPAAARALLRELDDELEAVELEGFPGAVQLAGAPEPEPDPAATDSVLLLPHFDCYVVGGHPRGRLIPPHAPAALQAGTAATFTVLVVDGVVAGLWQRHRRGRRLELRVDPFRPLGARQRRQLDEQAERIGAFFGSPVELQMGRVEPRAHL
jgi:hypothetical protein